MMKHNIDNLFSIYRLSFHENRYLPRDYRYFSDYRADIADYNDYRSKKRLSFDKRARADNRPLIKIIGDYRFVQI